MVLLLTVELSASRHAGIMEYSFPEGAKHVLIDVSHVCCFDEQIYFQVPTDRGFQYLPESPGDANGQIYTGGEIQIEDDGKSYSGYGTYVGGWNNGKFPR